MGVKYEAVIWNKQKKQYDKIILAIIALLLASLIISQFLIDPNISTETLIIRTTSITATFLLHVILVIGPLCRLNSNFLPLLYNRRHLGVTMFFFALIHSVFSIVQFHALGDINPILSIFLSNTKYLEISQFPFQVLGFFALVIFFLMAATSHDFWLKNLSPKFWKTLHMLVYLAYALVILHIALGILQYENKAIYWTILIASFSLVAGLHIVSGVKNIRSIRKQKRHLEQNGFYKVCAVDEINESCATAVFIDDQNIAIFKYENHISAVSNICKHQMGPLSEGKIVDGCITCPWHGYQYLPQNGQSPPPFEEKLATYETQILKQDIWVNPSPLPEGTAVTPSKIVNG